MKPCTVRRGLSKDGKLLFFAADVANSNEVQRRLDKSWSSYITVNTGLIDHFGDEIYVGDIVSKVKDPNGNTYIVRAFLDDDGEPEPYFFVDGVYYEDDDEEQLAPLYKRIKFNHRNAARYIIQDNIYHVWEREE